MSSRPTSKNLLKGRTRGHVRDTRGHAYFLVTQTIQFAPVEVDTQTMIIFTSTEAGFN